jgi:hypothetical protein
VYDTCTYSHVYDTCTYSHVYDTCTYSHVYDTCTYSHVYDSYVKDDPTIRLSPCFLPNLSHYDPIPVDSSVKDELARARAVHRKVKLAEASQGVPALATIYSTAALCPL